MELTIINYENTLLFGKLLGQFILKCRQYNKIHPTVFCLNGDLGTGKTTFTGAFVSVFPGSDEAEVASPSFTLCHEYPTCPEIYHADLYRLPSSCELPHELLDLPKDSLLLIEWAERLAPSEEPELCIFISFKLEKSYSNNNSENILKKSVEKLDNFDKSCEKKRQITIYSKSELLNQFLQDLEEFFKQNSLT